MKPVHEVNDGIINTVSGIEIDLVNPSPDMILIQDIAISLGNTCRFTGQLKRFYSVAQHSVMVAVTCPRELRKYGLLHDATEAYLHDISKPLKVLLGDVYKDIEARFLKVIALKFNLDPALFDSIKPYDQHQNEIEHKDFQLGQFHEWQAECRTIDAPTAVYGPDHATGYFMGAFYSIFGSEFIN